MKKIIKWSALLIAFLVLVSLIYYVKEKKNRPLVSSDELLRLALIEIREHKNYSKAISLTKQALMISPDYSDVQITRAHAYMLNGNMDSAKWDLEKLLIKDKKNGPGLLYLVNISMQEKDTVSGLKYLAQYNTYYPEKREILLKEYVLLLAQKEYKKAGIVYSSYIKQFNKDTIQMAGFDYWRSKAISERKASDPVSAYNSYKKALSYQPGDTAVLQQLTHLSLQFNNSALALKYNNELLKQDSSNRQYLVTASTIYKILQDDENAALYANKAYESNPSDQLAKRI